MKRKKSPPFDAGLNLDSLVDIVSNSVGILIILSVFTALLSLTPAPPKNKEKPQESGSVKKIRIPWSHISQKKSLLFVIQNNRILYLDQSAVYQSLKKKLSGNNGSFSSFLSPLQFDGYSVTLQPQSNQTHCLDFQPKPDAGEWWHQASSANGIIQRLIAESSAKDQYFFFWVDGPSFELFRSVRSFMWDHRFEVGWKPINRSSKQGTPLPLEYCVGFTRALSFQPQ